MSESDIPWQGQDHQTRKVLLAGVHAIFSANPKTAAWASGHGDLSESQFVAEFKSLKPCFHGSDAHQLDKICVPDLDRYCWIKADTTFEGLKQVLYEPTERVFIGITPPKLKNDYQLIKSVRVKAPSWFSSEEIPINYDLVAIIGGRGSGKSALGELIAFAGGSKTFNEGQDVVDSFLYKASKKSVVNATPIGGAKIVLEWQQGPPTEVMIPVGLKHNFEQEKIEYLPQKFVERLCAPENTERLEEQIEHVIFQRIDKSERLSASGFRELRDVSTRPIQLKKSQVKKTIQSLSSSISTAQEKRATRAQKVREIVLKRAELATLTASSPQPPEEASSEMTQREQLTKLREQLQTEISDLNEQSAALNTIASRIEIMRAEITNFNEEIEQLLPAARLETVKDLFRMALPNNVATILDRRRVEIATAIQLKRGGVAEPSETKSLNSIDSELGQLDKKSMLTETKKREYAKYQKDKRTLEDMIASLEREIKDIDEVYLPRIKKDQETRLKSFAEYFDLLKEEQQQLEILYRPLQDALSKSNETARRLEFISKITMNVTRHAVDGYDLIDRRKVMKDDQSMEVALKKFFDSIEQEEFSLAQITDATKTLYETILNPAEYPSVQEILRAGKRAVQFADWFFNTDPFSVTYSIKYDGKDLQFLSPGEKGIVLLLLYLEAEQEDNRPLIIDQPDDNLDNLSVYPSLVEYFRRRKKSRQIIIITHNPNLVVNTDAEQVVVADFDGSRSPKIRYRSGALEDADPAGDSGMGAMCAKS